MRYPDSLWKVAERLVATTHTVPRRKNQWSHIADYERPEWVLPALHLARLLDRAGGRAVRAAVRRLARERDYSLAEEVQSLHDLTWALDAPLARLGLYGLQAKVGRLEAFLGRLSCKLEGDDDAGGDG